MRVADRLNHLDQRFAWSLSGFVLAAIFGSFAVYTEFFRDTRPAIQIEIIGSSSVFDVKEDVGDLQVVYAGRDLRKSGQSLRVVVVRITNSGGEDILKSYYDEDSPLGLELSDGSLVSVEVQGASEAYLVS